MRFQLVLAVLLLLPGPLGAQAGAESEGQVRARPAAALLLKSSRLADQGRLHLGGWAGLVFSGRLALGGAGLALVKAVELPGSTAGTGFQLRMGYGGIVLRYWEPFSHGLTAEAGLLLGAGNGEVRDQLSGRELGSDNFFVAEPEVALSFTPLSGLHLGASTGYRLVGGVQDLPRVSSDDLGAWTWTFFLRLGGR